MREQFNHYSSSSGSGSGSGSGSRSCIGSGSRSSRSSSSSLSNGEHILNRKHILFVNISHNFPFIG